MRFDLSGCGAGLDESAKDLLELETERWLREVAIIGSPDTVAARIAGLRDEFAFGNVMLVTGFLGNYPQEAAIWTIEPFATEVRPRFQTMLPRSQSLPGENELASQNAGRR